MASRALVKYVRTYVHTTLSKVVPVGPAFGRPDSFLAAERRIVHKSTGDSWPLRANGSSRWTLWAIMRDPATGNLLTI